MQLQYQAPEGPYISLGTVVRLLPCGLLGDDLGCHVRGRPSYILAPPASTHSQSTHCIRTPEVRNLDHSVPVDENVVLLMR